MFTKNDPHSGVAMIISTDALSNDLRHIQQAAIGLFRLNVAPVDEWEVVTDKLEHTVRTLSIGRFLGLTINHYNLSDGNFVPFPDGKTLDEMQEDRTAWRQWCLVNNIVK